MSEKFWEEIGVPLSSIGQARKIVELAFASGTVPCLVGHAGIGKTETYKQIARDRGWGYVALYAQLSMPEDIAGLPFRAEDGKSYDCLIDKRLREKVEANPQGGILVFEEVNRASRDTASAVFAFMDNRGAGSWRLPDTWHIAIAQNPAGGEYAVNDLNSDHAFRRRVTWVAVREDARGWIEYGEKTGFDSRVIEYVKAHPAMLLDATTRTSGKTYANPAAWEKVSKTLTAMKALGINDLELARAKLSGDIGEVAADGFIEYVKNSDSVMSPQEVLSYYADKNADIRRRVKGKISEGALDRVSALASSVVQELVRGKPEACKELAANIGEFLLDLPKELTAAFFSEMSSSKTPEDAPYLARVNKYCGLNGSYQKAIKGLSKSIEAVEDEIS